MPRMPVLRLLLGIILLMLPAWQTMGAPISAASRRIATRAIPLAVACDPISPGVWTQYCVPSPIVRVKTTSVLRFQFRVSPAACSAVRIRILGRGELGMFVDELYASDALRPGLATPPVDVGPVPRGTRDYAIEVVGIPSGCNTSGLQSWSGKLTVTTSRPGRR